jgi:hypothetical protein
MSSTFSLKKAQISKTEKGTTSQTGSILCEESLTATNVTAQVSMAVRRSDMSIIDFTSLIYLQSANKVSKEHSISQTDLIS